LFRLVHDAHAAFEYLADHVVTKIALNREESHRAMLGKVASKSSVGVSEISPGGRGTSRHRFFFKIFVDYLPSFDKVAPLVERKGIPSGSNWSVGSQRFVTRDNKEKRN
jgi:hypothetical protein